MVVAMWDEKMEFLNVSGIPYIYVYVYYVSSPYLLVFGDDRVCGTRE